MSGRDHEDLPDAPDLADVRQEDTELTRVGSAGTDPWDAGYVPPDLWAAGWTGNVPRSRPRSPTRWPTASRMPDRSDPDLDDGLG